MRKEYEKILAGAKKVIAEVDKSYGEVFGRSYGGMVEKYRCEDADSILVTIRSRPIPARASRDGPSKQTAQT
ncbi:MAG: hypothetical protein J7M38_03710, partial [Armatimonadetes bacterium]|nr:hypothetical protein [Armatimonadota bacterium]